MGASVAVCCGSLTSNRNMASLRAVYNQAGGASSTPRFRVLMLTVEPAGVGSGIVRGVARGHPILDNPHRPVNHIHMGERQHGDGASRRLEIRGRVYDKG